MQIDQTLAPAIARSPDGDRVAARARRRRRRRMQKLRDAKPKTMANKDGMVTQAGLT